MIDNEKTTNKREFFKVLTEEKLSRFPQVFEEFINEPTVISKGDRLLTSGVSTGYNYAKEADFPLDADAPVIIYNNYVQRSSHFAQVLVEMEERGLIDDNYSFGAKATKVIGDWSEKEAQVSQINNKRKVITTSSSVEGCLILRPRTPIEALKMVEFLATRTVKNDEVTFIEGSWEIPDVRSNPFLEELLIEAGYKVVYANSLKVGEGNLITLKRSEKVIKRGWVSKKVLINEALYEFID